MSRWEVFSYQGVTGRCWAAGEVGKLGIKLFFTHAEALAYADRMARTREVVLPRNHGLKKVLLETAIGGVFANYESDDYLVIDYFRNGPKPLALALLALHYQQEVEE